MRRVGREDRVDYGAVVPWKSKLLRASYARYERVASAALRDEFVAFCAAQAAWLDEFALFMALKDKHDGAPWTRWATPFARRDPEALAEARATLAGEIAFHRYTQFLFYRQWGALRKEARKRGISIIGDLAIFVAHDSADVWANQRYFKLDAAWRAAGRRRRAARLLQPDGTALGQPDLSLGCARRRRLRLVDRARRGTLWSRPILSGWTTFAASRPTGRFPAISRRPTRGAGCQAPARRCSRRFEQALGEPPFIAEDLGVITPDVDALRERFGFPGMRVMQFALRRRAKSQPSAAQLERQQRRSTPARTTTTPRRAGLRR